MALNIEIDENYRITSESNMSDCFKYIFEPIKKVNKSKLLSQALGGKWKYDGISCWWCDDDKRHVARTSSCSCDDTCNHPAIYYLYGNGVPKIICWNDLCEINKEE